MPWFQDSIRGGVCHFALDSSRYTWKKVAPAKFRRISDPPSDLISGTCVLFHLHTPKRLRILSQKQKDKNTVYISILVF